MAFYEFRQIGLGHDFFLNFESAMVEISEHPERYRIQRQPYFRRKNRRRFPHYIISMIVNETIQVLAIAHHKRHPDYWLKRTAKV